MSGTAYNCVNPTYAFLPLALEDNVPFLNPAHTALIGSVAFPIRKQLSVSTTPDIFESVKTPDAWATIQRTDTRLCIEQG